MTEQEIEIPEREEEYIEVEHRALKDAAPGQDHSTDWDIEIGNDTELLEWCEGYAHKAVTEYDTLRVDLSQVHWGTLSETTNGRAATTFTITPDDATVGERIDWKDTRQNKLGVTEYDPIPDTEYVEDVEDCRIFISWTTVLNLDEEEVKATIRHELLHAQQHQLYGATDHGDEFREWLVECDGVGAAPAFDRDGYVFTLSDFDAAQD